MLDDKTQAFNVVLLSNDSVFRLFIMCINVKRTPKGQSIMDSPETLAILGEQGRVATTKTKQNKNKTKHRKLAQYEQH